MENHCQGNAWGSQEENLTLEAPVDDAERKSGRDKNYLSAEDETLCLAYLNVPKDAIYGTPEQGKPYWARITTYYNQMRKTPIERSQNSLQHRWGDILKETSKFCGYYSEIVGRNESGKSEDDKIKDAMQLYEARRGKQFKFLHCWLLLRGEQKWNEFLASASTKTTPEQIPQVGLVDVEPNEQPTLPTRKKQRTNSSSVNSTSCFEILQKIQLDRAKFEKDLKAANKDECDKMTSYYERKLALQEQHLQIATRSVIVQEKMLMLQEKDREDRIMAMDLEKVSLWAREYYVNQQKLIVTKSNAECSNRPPSNA